MLVAMMLGLKVSSEILNFTVSLAISLGVITGGRAEG